MAHVMIRMKLALLRGNLSGWRLLRLVLGVVGGLLAAAGTLWLGTASAHLLAAVVGAWTAGWIFGPVLTGDQNLRAEYFRAAPVEPVRLAGGLLAAACVSVPALVTLAAFASLPLYGFRSGLPAGLVAVAAMVLHVALVILLARVVLELLGAGLRSRRWLDLVALAISLLIGGGVVGGLLIWEPAMRLLGRLSAGAVPPLPDMLWAVPTGWGAVAVDAAGRGDWLPTVAPLVALAVLDAALLLLWTALLKRRLTTPATAGRPRRTHGVREQAPPMLSSATGAALVRALRCWIRDTGLHIIAVAVFGVGAISAVLGTVGWPYLLPLAAIFALAVAANESANLFGFDGTAFWLTVAAGGERAEIRGRQIAWLLIFTPVSLVIAITAFLAAGPETAAAWPYVAALLPALLGAGSGLVVLFSVLAPYPVGYDNPVADSGKSRAAPIRRALVPLLTLAVLPVAGIVAAGQFLAMPVLLWAGIATGVVTGILVAWLAGRLAWRRLRSTGPEILATLQKGREA